MNRVTKLLEHMPEILRRDAASEPPLFPPADPLQYARFVIPGIPARPWYDDAEFSWTAGFADSYGAIRDELMAFLAQQRVTFRNYVGPIAHEKADAGEWHVLYLHYRDHVWTEHRAMFPTLCRCVDTIPRRCGTVFISRLTPGAHIPMHCGATNTQLTCHFGIVVPDGVEVRVAREIRRQPAGRCVVFDDSFEHEVWNRADSVRYNVFMQFWHPDLSDEEIAAVQRLEELPHIHGLITKYLEGAEALAHVPN